ncbi:MAG TPA: DCC1-like thiol-disulfide oxidoreductase family protein [Chitinophagaceae bacterium]|nr:DCC1-like thiol-disulfide oxidoreductase family protein [Chitinophagaceae bacterium]
MATLHASKYIVFFDGICNLCNHSIQVIIRNDTQKRFKFASLQSDFCKNFFKEKHFLPLTPSIILWDGKKFVTQSSAVLGIAIKLRFPYPLLAMLYVFPPFLRNTVYGYIAANRYKWFGKRDTCMLPTPELKDRFF